MRIVRLLHPLKMARELDAARERVAQLEGVARKLAKSEADRAILRNRVANAEHQVRVLSR